jgi:hypothetical protein
VTGVACTHTQCGEVVDRARERLTQIVPVRPNLRYLKLPCRERVTNARPLFAEVPLDDMRGGLLCAVRRRQDVDPQVPGLARCERHVECDCRPLDRSLLRQQDLRAAVSLRVDEHEPVLRLLEMRNHRVG